MLEFQTVDQIKELVVKDKKEDAQKRVYSIALKLQDSRVPGKYAAEAMVVYEMADAHWKCKYISLISLSKVE